MDANLAALLRRLYGLGGQYVKDAMPGGSLNPELSAGNVRSAGEALSMMPNPAGDIASGMLAVDDLRKGDYLGAAGNAAGILPFVPGMAGVVKNFPMKFSTPETSHVAGKMAELAKVRNLDAGVVTSKILKGGDTKFGGYVFNYDPTAKYKYIEINGDDGRYIGSILNDGNIKEVQRKIAAVINGE